MKLVTKSLFISVDGVWAVRMCLLQSLHLVVSFPPKLATGPRPIDPNVFPVNLDEALIHFCNRGPSIFCKVERKVFVWGCIHVCM